MRLVRTTLIAAAATAALAGAAIAAKDDHKLMLVALPDESVQHIRYLGDVAPQVVIVREAAPISLFEAAFGPASPFAEIERISAAMDAHAAAMMRQAEAMRAQAPAPTGKGVVMTDAQGQPVGVMRYSYVSSTTSADGCTRTISYSSDGASAGQPKVINTSSGNCATAGPSPAIAPATAAKPLPVNPTRATPAPRITPVSAPKPQPEFTPSIVI